MGFLKPVRLQQLVRFFFFFINNQENLLYLKNLTIGHVSHCGKHALQSNVKEYSQNVFFCTYSFSFHNCSLPQFLGSNSSQQDILFKKTYWNEEWKWYLLIFSFKAPFNPNLQKSQLKKPRRVDYCIICKILPVDWGWKSTCCFVTMKSKNTRSLMKLPKCIFLL